jgi:hypothetical protein
MYTLYHIPKRKEWGCTTNLEYRLKKLDYQMLDVDRIITVGNINKAADMEAQLNIEYGYGWNTSQDYRRVTRMGLIGGKLGALKRIGGKCFTPLVAVLVYDKNNKFVGEYKSVKEAGEMLDISSCGISNVLNNKRKSIYGYKIKYK